MSIAVDGDIIRLAGRCGAEEAETLLVALRDNPGTLVDLGEAQRLHLAIVQILLAVRPQLAGRPNDPFLLRHVLPALE